MLPFLLNRAFVLTTLLCLGFILTIYFVQYNQNPLPFFSSVFFTEQHTESEWSELYAQIELLQPYEEKTYTKCPYQPSNSIYKYSLRYWKAINDTEIRQAKFNWQSFVRTIPNYPHGNYSGYGIVSSTSTNENFQRTLAQIKLLRWLNCQLPIEIYSFEGELNETEVITLHTVPDVQVKFINDIVDEENRNVPRYAIKPNAILQSRFKHVLWLDCDNIPVKDPTYLFHTEHYKQSTAMFWPDFWISSSSNPVWRIFDLECRQEDYEQESGQILINKETAWKPLNLAVYLNKDPFIQNILRGDKETFRLAWKVLKVPFYFIRKFLAVGGFDYVKVDKNGNRNLSKTDFCGHTTIQHDPKGDIIFLHLNAIKYNSYIKYPVELKHIPLIGKQNPWKTYRRYSNTHAYFRPQIIDTNNSDWCTYLPMGEHDHYPPVFETDFHTLVAANITAKYIDYGGLLLKTRRRKTKETRIEVVDRIWN
ncbi:unnamed protein product [Didymodactylos carnosus]|uniref:Glycosyltransferase family 71 protein n=1 Tax=Didymodactylos carnosus TaxID=1234261 RepID=A0A813QZS3_9BILA|nr:unnamed protein product [Didymodactylos carnosus]CAF1115421.1 unnamed protein product [Didymodactylos carnosus]CAF3556799.1 unnamed protein product [Didymodactylos carnosus]CAF3885403.1 unnamed protein product [Didymodactylos carnosus]